MFKLEVWFRANVEPQVLQFQERIDALKYANKFRDLKAPKVKLTRLTDNRVIFSSERKQQ